MEGVLPANHCWCQKDSDCPFMWHQNIRSALFGFVTKHACDRRTDVQSTDGQNYDSQDRASTACAVMKLKCLVEKMI